PPNNNQIHQQAMIKSTNKRQRKAPPNNDQKHQQTTMKSTNK
ncbi:18071_t:CDS:1, partial [Racocetra persica]